jgi:hypothetical protein
MPQIRTEVYRMLGVFKPVYQPVGRESFAVVRSNEKTGIASEILRHCFW